MHWTRRPATAFYIILKSSRFTSRYPCKVLVSDCFFHQARMYKYLAFQVDFVVRYHPHVGNFCIFAPREVIILYDRSIGAIGLSYLVLSRGYWIVPRCTLCAAHAFVSCSPTRLNSCTNSRLRIHILVSSHSVTTWYVNFISHRKSAYRSLSPYQFVLWCSAICAVKKHTEYTFWAG